MPHLLITGAARGIGLALTKIYLENGWDVTATCRAPSKASTLADLASAYASLNIAPLDVTDDVAIATLGASLDKHNVALDLLINNAGIISGIPGGAAPHLPTHDPSQSVGSTDRAAWLAVFSTNTIAPLKVAEALLPALRRAKGAKIAMISSVMGRIERGEAGHLAYCSSKAALNSVMFALAEDLRSDGISVISLHPGWVRSDMGGPNGRLTPEESAAGLYKVIKSLTIHDTGHFVAYDGAPLTW